MTLNKHDIAEYYSDPEVRAALLTQLKNRPTMVVNTREGKSFVRRNTPQGKPIRILQALNDSQNANDLAWYTNRRYSEFHPAIGKKTRQVWVDIDPGPKRTIEELKPVVVDVDNALKRIPLVKSTRISYSGGRGFYVRGDLQRKAPTDEMRKIVQQKLNSLGIEKAVDRKPHKDEVRLDTSTLHNKGSIRADYSINSATGRVAVPLTQRELRGFTPEQAEVKRIIKEKEFAPGIPRSRRIYALPEETEPRQWTMAIQQHDARKAGKHWDLRLVDPDTGFAHSWAVPKSTFPEQAKKVLAVRTPTHTAHYALNFGDIEPQTIGKGYGKGTVRIVHKEPVKIVQSGNNKVKFQRILGGSSGEKYTLFRTKDNMWLLRQEPKEDGATMEKEAAYGQGYFTALMKLGLAKNPGPLDEQRTDELADTDDDNLPVGQLVSAIANLDFPIETERGKRPPNPRSRAEERLNKDVEWSATSSIPPFFMEGATPILQGRF